MRSGSVSMSSRWISISLRGRVGLSSFDDAMVLRAAVQDFLPRVSSLSAAGAVHPRWADVTLTLKDGTTLNERVEHLPGSVQRPIADDALAAKAADCLAFVAHPADAQLFAATALGEDGTMAEVLAALTYSAGSRAQPHSRSAVGIG